MDGSLGILELACYFQEDIHVSVIFDVRLVCMGVISFQLPPAAMRSFCPDLLVLVVVHSEVKLKTYEIL